jgi:hypothetical protein
MTIFKCEEDVNDYYCSLTHLTSLDGDTTTAEMVQFEVEILALNRMRSRVVWSESTSPWIEGGLEDLVVHFTYASWTAYELEFPITMLLTSKEENLGQAVADMMTKMIESMGAVQMAEIRLTREALDEMKRDRIGP